MCFATFASFAMVAGACNWTLLLLDESVQQFHRWKVGVRLSYQRRLMVGSVRVLEIGVEHRRLLSKKRDM